MFKSKPFVKTFHRLASRRSLTTPTSILPPAFLTELTTTHNLSINTNPYDLQSHGRGESYHPPSPPAAIVTPSSTQQVSTLLKSCQKFQVAVIPYGKGTSVEGHLCAMQPNCISLDMKNLTEIQETDDFQVTVGAGVTRMELNDALRHSGMQFMVDPGADASIGGMIACGASGTTAVKYGTMRENLLSLTCVLPDGTIANCGSRALKSSAGYDLTSLMTGSEGTLGVITEATVKLHPIPSFVTAAICAFDSVHEAAEVVEAIQMCAVPVERCELLDESSVAAFNQYTSTRGGGNSTRSTKGMTQLPIKPTLFLELTGSSTTAVQEQVDMTKSICLEEFNGSNFVFKDEEAERKALWAARHELYYASLALRPGATSAILTDACVPLSKFASLITSTVEEIEKANVVGPCFGHAGDGNFHAIFPVLDTDSQEYLNKIHALNDELIARTIEAGGTCTGEHGVGYGKIKYLTQQYGEGGVEMMRRVKTGLDPFNIMNPGKVVIV